MGKNNVLPTFKITKHRQSFNQLNIAIAYHKQDNFISQNTEERALLADIVNNVEHLTRNQLTIWHWYLIL